jgi:AraC-like DNA-binding protein
MLESIRIAAGQSWRPTEIHLEGAPPPHAEELAAYAAKSIHFGRPCTTLVFPAEVLALRYPTFPPQPALATGPIPAAELERACRQVVESLLKLGAAELSAAAELTRISERSLQRGLAARGFSFKQLVETVRFESAVRMLDDPGTKIVEIAAHLGYTDSANFTRAFRRWSGVAPRAFRQQAKRAARSA